jgi:hypothetical protein
MPDLQGCANPCNAWIITRNEQESGSSPLVGSLFFLQNSQKDKRPQWDDRRLGSSRAAVDYPKVSSRALACYKWLQGTAGGVGESSGIDRLTDVPEFGRVRHRRNSFARVPRS